MRTPTRIAMCWWRLLAASWLAALAPPGLQTAISRLKRMGMQRAHMRCVALFFTAVAQRCKHAFVFVHKLDGAYMRK